MDLDVVFLGTSASAPTARRGTALAARAARRRPPALRLRRGHAAPAPALLDRARRPRGDLRHPLPRRPLPRPARECSRRSRCGCATSPLTVYGPPGLRDLFDALAPHRRQGHLPARARRGARRATCSTRDGYELCVFPVDHGVPARRLRARRGRAARPLRRRRGRRARRPVRARARRAPARRGGDARRRPQSCSPSELVGPARPGRTVVYTGRHAAGGGRRDAVPRRRPADPRGDLRARTSASGRSRPGTRPRCEAAEVARDAGVVAARAHARLPALPRRPIWSARRRRSSRRTILPRDFDVVELPFRERGEPTLVKGGARPRAHARGDARHVTDARLRRPRRALRGAPPGRRQLVAGLRRARPARRPARQPGARDRLRHRPARRRRSQERELARVWAVDASENMVARAKALGVNARVARAEALPFKAGWFDAVVMRMSLHLVDRPRALAKPPASLHAGGRIAIATEDPESFERVWFTQFFPSVPAIDGERFPSREALTRRARRRRLRDGRDRAAAPAPSDHAREGARHHPLEGVLDLRPAARPRSTTQGLARAEAELPEQLRVPLRLAARRRLAVRLCGLPARVARARAWSLLGTLPLVSVARRAGHEPARAHRVDRRARQGRHRPLLAADDRPRASRTGTGTRTRRPASR